MIVKCHSERMRGISSFGRDASLTLSMTLLFRSVSAGICVTIVWTEILPLLRSSEWHRLSSRTYVRDPSQYARLGSSRQNLSEWYITVSVTSLGRRFFISLTLHSEWHMFWQEILQGKSHVTIVWREILHFTTISFRMTVKCHSEQMRGISRFYPSVWDILYRLLTMRGSLLSFFFLQLSIW